MNGLASSRVSSVEEAAKVLEYYNGFHDGFMKRIVIDSRDEIHADLSQSCTGVTSSGNRNSLRLRRRHLSSSQRQIDGEERGAGHRRKLWCPEASPSFCFCATCLL